MDRHVIFTLCFSYIELYLQKRKRWLYAFRTNPLILRVRFGEQNLLADQGNEQAIRVNRIFIVRITITSHHDIACLLQSQEHFTITYDHDTACFLQSQRNCLSSERRQPTIAVSYIKSNYNPCVGKVPNICRATRKFFRKQISKL